MNAVDRDALAAILRCVPLDDRRDLRVAMFTGSGTRAFMGGAEVSAIGGATHWRNDRRPTSPDSGRLARIPVALA